MADDVSIIDATGATQTIATDQVTDAVLGTAHVQFTKLMDARDSGTNRAAVDSGNNLQVNPQATVNDTPESYLVGTQQPLSLTPEGRLRVSTTVSDIKAAWQTVFDDPWGDTKTPWEMEKVHYV